MSHWGGGSGPTTTICGRCGARLEYSENRKTWLSEETHGMYCESLPSYRALQPRDKLPTIHKPVAGEAR
jgi:hypothetical protein